MEVMSKRRALQSLVRRGGFERRRRTAGRGSQLVPFGLAATALSKASSLPLTGLLLNSPARCLAGRHDLAKVGITKETHPHTLRHSFTTSFLRDVVRAAPHLPL
jgi:hypothetical protein